MNESVLASNFKLQTVCQKPVDLGDKNRFGKMSNESQGSCYCGKDRNLNIAELLCASCNRWFHESCIGYQLGKLVPFMTNYLFICKNCSPTGLETFKKNQAPFPQMCLTAIANLRQDSVKDGTNRMIFSKDREIIPYIDQYWEAMTTMPRRVTQSWYATVQRALFKDIQVMFTYEDDPNLGQMFGLFNTELTSIKPNYEAMIKQGQLKVTDMGIATIPLGGNVKGRQGKRRPALGGAAEGGAPAGKKGRAADPAALKLPSHGYPAEHPFNKDGYRYILAEPDPHAPFRQEFDESNEWSGKPIPGWLYRSLCPGGVLLALHDRAPQLKISEDRLAVTGDKGYCMVRATHGNTLSCVTCYHLMERQAHPRLAVPLAVPGRRAAGAARPRAAAQDIRGPARRHGRQGLLHAASPSPGWLYRSLCPGGVLLALHDRAPQLKISEDRLAVTGDKGYCMVRATHGNTLSCVTCYHLMERQAHPRLAVPLAVPGRRAAGAARPRAAAQDIRGPARRHGGQGLLHAASPSPAGCTARCARAACCWRCTTRAPQLKISEDRLAVTGDKGYCMVRATHGNTLSCVTCYHLMERQAHPRLAVTARCARGGVLLALHDRAPQLKISEDRLAVTGDKGYCMVRATHGNTLSCVTCYHLMERQAHPRLAVPLAVPGRRAAGAARPRAAAQDIRGPARRHGRQGLLHGARHAW
ncbi:hypothetical protein ACJJTC_018166 [Scirpophaga incertulas]